MRGPRGKGQCQVAITEDDGKGEGETAVERNVKQPSFGERIKMLTGVLKAGIQLAGSSEGMFEEGSGSGGMKKVEGLRCSMTYVNIPWQSLIRHWEPEAAERICKHRGVPTREQGRRHENPRIKASIVTPSTRDSVASRHRNKHGEERLLPQR
ncbi:hypothetical protein HK096_005062 [Nowakowskiella sp. JEL0078]|nr:hypothetical protein HK096_005062 [Nowakowskiella sp. JEL0078]